MTIQHLRVARATPDLGRIAAFYREVLEFEVIGSFEDHEGFDGVMLGRPGDAFHLEFTHERGARETAEPPSPEDLLVFYLDETEWLKARARLETLGVAPVPSHNPYWDRHGFTIEDPDGYRVVFHDGPWRTGEH